MTPVISGTPIACKLPSAEFRERKATVIAALKAAVLERAALPDGYSYTFCGDDATIDQLAAFIKTERECCAFFTFTLTVAGGRAVLLLTGPAGAREFVETEIGL